MKLRAAIQASETVTAAAKRGANEVYAGADGHDGTYELDIWTTSTHQMSVAGRGMTLDEIERKYPSLDWWPVSANGEWGEERGEDTTVTRE